MALQRRIERALRVSTLILNALAFPLIIPAAIESTKHSGRDPAPCFFAFIPLFFSLCLSIIYLVLQKRQQKQQVRLAIAEEDKQGAQPWIWPIGDFSVFGGYLAMLVVMWIREPGNLYSAASTAFLEAYATAPLIANMFIHFFLFLFNSPFLVRAVLAWSGAKALQECPHCHRQIGGPCEDRAKGKGKEEGYTLLRGEDYDEDARRASEERADVGEALVREV